MRPSIEEYMLNMARVASTRATCSRRAVGAVITDDLNHILSTGYNGVPRGHAHCILRPCKGADFGSGEGLDVCKAQHAEVNAIAHCRDLKSATTIYLTVSPCMACMKLIAATNIRRIVAAEIYNSLPLDYWEDIEGEFVHLK